MGGAFIKFRRLKTKALVPVENIICPCFNFPVKSQSSDTETREISLSYAFCGVKFLERLIYSFLQLFLSDIEDILGLNGIGHFRFFRSSSFKTQKLLEFWAV